MFVITTVDFQKISHGVCQKFNEAQKYLINNIYYALTIKVRLNVITDMGFDIYKYYR